MTAEERLALIAQIARLVERLEEEDHFPDASEGKVVWPLKDVAADEWLVGERDVSHADALATLWEIADCDLELTASKDEDGATGDIALAVAGVQTYDDAPHQFFYVPIKQALETALENYPQAEPDGEEPDPSGMRSRQLLIALLRAYTEWEAEGQARGPPR